MKTYEVKTRFTFEGVFKVKAENSTEARRLVDEDCGAVMSGGIHSTMPDEEVSWEFPIHPEKKIISMKHIKRQSK